MKISTRGRYGLRAMLDLARNHGNGPLLMSKIAENQNISRKYLHALLTSLKTAGLVRSVRGSGGGYVLAREPSEINLCEVFEVLEGSISLVDCVLDEESCRRAKSCVARDVWRSLSRLLKERLSGISLADLMSCNGAREAEHLFNLE